MKEVNTNTNVIPFNSDTSFKDELSVILKRGARQMLQAAIESEVAHYVGQFADLIDDNGRRLVVRNGHHPERSIQTGMGDIAIRKPKVNDKRVDEHGERFRFASSIIPPYLKRTKSIEDANTVAVLTRYFYQ